MSLSHWRASAILGGFIVIAGGCARTSSSDVSAQPLLTGPDPQWFVPYTEFGAGHPGVLGQSGNVHVERLLAPLDMPFEAVNPSGSLIHTSSASGVLAIVADGEDFESGSLGGQWTTASSTPDGRILVTGDEGTAAGSFAMIMDVAVSGDNCLNEATWTVDLTGVGDARLVFSHQDIADEETAFNGPFVGSFDADGIAISVDGTNWCPIFDAPSQPTGDWVRYDLDLAAAAANNGLVFGPNFQIRFQQFDNFPVPTDGRGWDEISIQVAGIDEDVFNVDVDPGQRMTVRVTPDPDVLPVLTVQHQGQVLATATASAAGEPALLQVVTGHGQLTGNGPGARTYDIKVSSTTTDPGGYSVDVILNAALEQEDNDTLPAAQNLDPAMSPLLHAVQGNIVGRHPYRAAVLGDFAGPQVTGEDFESGALGAQWATSSSDPQGRIRVTGDEGTAGGAFALLMDRDPSGSNTLNEAVWTVDLSGQNHAILAFWHAEWGDETHTFSGAPFVGSEDADGIAISADGNTWYPVFDPPNQSTGEWIRYELDLGAAAADAGIALGANFRIKFQQFDNFPIPTDGRGWDEISIQGGDPDTYCVNARMRDTITAMALGSGGIDLELVDAQGNVVAAAGDADITNGSFETGDFSGWTITTTGTPFRPWAVSGAGDGGGFGMDTTLPQDGSLVAWNGFDGAGPMEFTMSQDVAVPTGATLEWQHRIQWNFTLGGVATVARTFDVEVRDPGSSALLATLFSFSTGDQASNPTGDTGWQSNSADLSAFGGSTVRLVFREQIPESGTGPGQLELDGIGIAGASGTNVDAVVANYEVKTAGPVYVRATGGAGDYDLLVLRNADFELEGNDSTADAQPIGSSKVTGRRWMMGAIDEGGDVDVFRIAATEGAVLTIETRLPGDEAGAFDNQLDPQLRLLDAAGVEVAADDNSAADGRGALIGYTVPMGASGTYFVEVSESPLMPSTGEYVLTIQGDD